jgi:hypothetical protein
MAERLTNQTHEKRRIDAQQIHDLGSLYASAAASISFIANSAPPEACIAFKEKAAEEYGKKSRDQQIKSLLHIQEFLAETADTFHPRARDNSIAFQTRRLEIISRICRANIAEGNMAVDTADLLLGAYRFKLEGNQLYKEWLADYH